MGKELGAGVILDYARRFGFYKDPPVDLPADERAPSGLYRNGKLLPESQEGRSDPGRLAFGQERMLVTPMQMAMVAATVASGGVVMEPYLTDRIRAPDGSIVQRMQPDELRRAIKEETASQLASMMESVVSGGTGTAAQIGGVRVAGKTGTAETGQSGRNVAGFIAFAPVDRPRVAIAVYLQNQSGTGGTVAAPIAKQVLQALLRVPSNSGASG
jgi:penicillin-binding protein A